MSSYDISQFGLRSDLDGQIYDSFDKPDTVLNGTLTLSGHKWSVSGNGHLTTRIHNGELISDGVNFYASVDYGKVIKYMQATFSFSKIANGTIGTTENCVMILQGGTLNLGTMIHLITGGIKGSFAIIKRLNNGSFIDVAVTKTKFEQAQGYLMDTPYRISMQLEDNVLTITDGVGNIFTAVDDDFITINPSRATIQIAPVANAQYIGKFHSIGVGEKAPDNSSEDGGAATNYDSTDWVNLMSPPYNAAPKSDVTTVLKSTLNSMNTGTIYVPDGDYYISQTITLKPKINIVCGSSTIFRPSATANNFTMFEFPTYQVRNDKTVFTGLRIRGENKNVVGLRMDNVINAYFYDCTIEGCNDVGLELHQSQFNQFYNLILFNNKINLYINAGKGNEQRTGGNSNTFYNLTLASGTVGCLAENVSGNYFFSVIPLANKITNFAFFDCYTNYIIGGCPEGTGVDAPNTAFIDLKGRRIKKSTVYCNNAIMCIENMENKDATVKPSILLENDSSLDYVNPRGYGQPFYPHVACDESSSVALLGKFDAAGNFENISAIPSSITIRSRNGFTLEDNTTYDKYMPNAALNPLTPSIGKLTSQGYIGGGYTKTDIPTKSSVQAVQFEPSITAGVDKAVMFDRNVFPNGISKTYTGIAFNLKTHIDTTIKVELGAPTAADMIVKMKADEWRRICLIAKNATNCNVFITPQDTAGPELSVTRLCSVNTDNKQVIWKLLSGHFDDGTR